MYLNITTGNKNNTSDELQLVIPEDEMQSLFGTLFSDNAKFSEIEDEDEAMAILRQWIYQHFEEWLEDAHEYAHEDAKFNKLVDRLLVNQEERADRPFAREHTIAQRNPELISRTDYPIFASLEVDDREWCDRQDYYQDSWADRF